MRRLHLAIVLAVVAAQAPAAGAVTIDPRPHAGKGANEIGRSASWAGF